LIDCKAVRRDDRTGVRLVDCMGVRTGNRVDVFRAVRRAVRRDDCTAIDRMGGYTADCRTFLVY
jgi:hypothetical protein